MSRTIVKPPALAWVSPIVFAAVLGAAWLPPLLAQDPSGTQKPGKTADDLVDESLTRRVSLDFQEAPLSDVLDYLHEFARVNFAQDPSARVGSDGAPVAAGTVTLKVEDVSIKSALSAALHQLQLESKTICGCVAISNPKRLQTLVPKPWCVATAEDPEWKRTLVQRLESKRVNVNFRESPLDDVLLFLGEFSKYDFDAAAFEKAQESASPAPGTAPRINIVLGNPAAGKTSMSLVLEDIPVRDVLTFLAWCVDADVEIADEMVCFKRK